MVKAILFDKDGTLFGFTETWGPWTADFLRDLATDEDHAHQMAGAVGFDLAAQRFDPASPVIAGTPDDSALRLAPHLPDWDYDALLAHCTQAARSVQPVQATPLAPLLATLGRTHILGVMTNDAEQAARDQLHRCGVVAHFAQVIGFDSGHGAKPDPGPLLAFAAHVSLAPAEILMVGDSTHDLDAARAAGCVPLGVLTGPATRDTLRAAGAVDVLDDISQLPDYLGTP